MCGFIAQLVEHRTGIAEVTGPNPVEALILFFRLLLSSCLNWKTHCEDHSSLSSITAVHMNYFIYIYTIKNFASSRFTEIVYKSSSEDSRKCRRRFKLFVDLLDSPKQGTTGQLNIYDVCWLLQTVPWFADFAGVVEITRLNTSEFLYLSG